MDVGTLVGMYPTLYSSPWAGDEGLGMLPRTGLGGTDAGHCSLAALVMCP